MHIEHIVPPSLCCLSRVNGQKHTQSKVCKVLKEDNWSREQWWKERLGQTMHVSHQVSDNSYVLQCHFVEENWGKSIETQCLFTKGTPETCIYYQSQSKIF